MRAYAKSYGPDGLCNQLRWIPRWTHPEFPKDTWRTCINCRLSGWREVFATLHDFFNRCPRCKSFRLRSSMEPRNPEYPHHPPSFSRGGESSPANVSKGASGLKAPVIIQPEAPSVSEGTRGD